MATVYNTEFYNGQSDGSYSSARLVVPILAEIVAPGSVVDVGCGCGTWLKAFQEIGISDILGIDGGYVDRSRLRISDERFVPTDLVHPVAIGRTFDLAMSLECAEHLPPSAAEGFVRFLVSLAPVVLLSAAAPGQGGVHHVNEQWPSYWASLFSRHGYVAADALRPRIWRLPGIRPWYRQNALFYVSADKIASYPGLLTHSMSADDSMIDVGHPEMYQRGEALPWRQLLQLLSDKVVRRVLRRSQ